MEGLDDPAIALCGVRVYTRLQCIYTGKHSVPISIRSRRVETLVRDVARRTGENLTQAIERALQERLARLRTEREKTALRRRLRRIVRSISRLPDLDKRTPEEILGYDEHGLPR
jgi:antitoxin VapB